MIEDYINVEGGQIFYTVSGTGEPLIFIHGNFNDHRIWDEQTRAFSSLYKTIRYDLRGYGLSSTPSAPFSNVEDLKALVDALKLANVTLVGSSLGGGVAIDFTLAYPHLVRGLVLVSPSINGHPYPIRMMWQGIKNFMNVRLQGHERAIESFIANPFWQYFFPTIQKEKARSIVLDNVRTASSFCRFPPSLSAASKPCAINRLHEINIPTYIVISDEDHPFNIKTAETLHQNIRLSSKITVQGCGHLPFIEEPEQFNRSVLNFLSSPNAAETKSQ